MTDFRNFRSSYLEKVGIKGVEEKKSLEILLKEQPVDLSRLSQFCIRFPVPAAYRLHLWKILLGVVPAHQESHDFVMEQRREQYQDMLEALQVMGRITKETPLQEVHLRMFLIEEGCLPFDESKMFQDRDNIIFIAMATAMQEETTDPVEIYWLTSSFYRHHHLCRDSLDVMAESVEKYLCKEDVDYQLHTHLTSVRAFSLIPLRHWFRTAFAGVLPENSFERVWDKVIGGSVKVLLFVAVSILLTFKRPLLTMKTSEDILKFLSKIADDSADLIVSKAIDLWQKNGSHLMPLPSKSESPALVDKKS